MLPKENRNEEDITHFSSSFSIRKLQGKNRASNVTTLMDEASELFATAVTGPVSIPLPVNSPFFFVQLFE